MKAQNKVIPLLTVILMIVFAANVCAQRPRPRTKQSVSPSPAHQVQKYVLVDTGQIKCYGVSTEIPAPQEIIEELFVPLPDEEKIGLIAKDIGDREAQLQKTPL
ncbi:MAG: hypothetical protein MUP98_20345 [Candidatus Aminicenantes bacterium]|nr:hypothetical protein [Candidatus Aminicenantes bacterium]